MKVTTRNMDFTDENASYDSMGRQEEPSSPEDNNDDDNDNNNDNDNDNDNENDDNNNAVVADDHTTMSSRSNSIANLHETYIRLCENEGIPSEIAIRAARESRESNRKWWGGGGISQWLSSPSKSTSSMATSSSFSADAGKEEPDAQIVWALRQNPLPAPVAASAVNLLKTAKADALAAIQNSRGDVTNPRFLAALKVLSSLYMGYGHDARGSSTAGCVSKELDGSWISLSRPSFPGCLGNNEQGDFIYSLGRMSFDMFRPVGLKCSITRIHNEIETITDEKEQELIQQRQQPTAAAAAIIPPAFQAQVMAAARDGSREGAAKKLRKYNLVIHFMIEPRKDTDSETSLQTPAPSSPIRAVMTNNGYILPDANIPNRFNVWFTGGELGPYATVTHKNKRQQQPSQQLQQQSQSLNMSSCALSLHNCRRFNRRCVLHGVGMLVRIMEWEDIFGQEESWKRTLGEKAKALAAKMILRAEIPEKMEDDGTMSYHLHRPVAGHVDTLYLDEDLRITRGNHGSIMVQGRRKDTAEERKFYASGRRSSSSSTTRTRSRRPSYEGNNTNASSSMRGGGLQCMPTVTDEKGEEASSPSSSLQNNNKRTATTATSRPVGSKKIGARVA